VTGLRTELRRPSSAALLAECLGRIDALEPAVRAFTWLGVERARGLAAAADSDDRPRLLSGVPVGVKDIIDTAAIPTEYGSPAFEGRVPELSASVVLALEEAGAILLGKTVTAELAFAVPGTTRNPWSTDRTPGGSSMGSAAAVAAGMVPIAIGTQTNSSVIMPAALCGAVGYKPAAGGVALDGILAFSPTLDQFGCFAGSVRNVATVAAAAAGADTPVLRPADTPRLAVARTSDWMDAAPAVKQRFEDDLDALRDAGARIDEPRLPAAVDQARDVHRTIMAFEAAVNVAPLVRGREELLSPVLRRFLAEGASITQAVYDAALGARRERIEQWWRWAAPFDAVLTPAAPDEAPLRESTLTGDPRFCTRWSLVGAPALVLPTGLGPHGLPIGLQLVGSDDERLLAAAHWAETLLPPPQLT
jgi:Asp-tRNA(Asn)/Glu-tRNA(Gln) amidotransferase A subunit family amidase